ncbi:MAG: SRPBCC family protein [Candidatus Kaistia colombiensis]|nr:MAG: SRPBCC family protein [Kaistia sp.]
MLKFILIATILLVVAITAVLAYAATRPGSLRVERQARIQAPAATIFPLINDFHRWAEWSPYENIDPTVQRSFDGAPAGKGAVYRWSGDGKAGAGRMEIADTAPPSRIRIRLDFTRPMRASNIAEFTLEPDGDATRVRWTMEGPTSFIGKLFGIFVDMDNMIGRDFATGLANLKMATERR